MCECTFPVSLPSLMFPRTTTNGPRTISSCRRPRQDEDEKEREEEEEGEEKVIYGTGADSRYLSGCSYAQH